MRGFDSCPVYAVMCNKMSFCPSPSAALCFISLGCLGSAWSGGGGVASRKGECGTQSCFLELGPQSFILSVAGPAPPDMGALLKFQQITTTLCTCVYVCVSVCVSLCVYVCVCVCKSLQSCPTLCNPVDRSPPGSSVHGGSPGKNTGVVCHALLQGIFPTQGLNLHLSFIGRSVVYHWRHLGSLLTHKFETLSQSSHIQREEA